MSKFQPYQSLKLAPVVERDPLQEAQKASQSLFRLSDAAFACTWLQGRTQRTSRFCIRSQAVEPGDVFLAWPGKHTDARQYVQEALERGACACILEAEGLNLAQLPGNLNPNDFRLAAFAGLQAAAGSIISLYYQEPSKHLDVIAVTGTNGKSTVTLWLQHALNKLAELGYHIPTFSTPALRPEGNQGHLPQLTHIENQHAPPAAPICGVIGSLGYGTHVQSLKAFGLTTPEVNTVQEILHEFVEEGLHFCAIEASSIGIVEGRLNGTRVRIAVFTNFSHDHLDYHKTMQAYWEAKLKLFSWPELQGAVVNIDDPYGYELANYLMKQEGLSPLKVWTVSSKHSQADLWVFSNLPTPEGMRFSFREINEEGEIDEYHLYLPVLGHHNTYNAMCVIGVLRALGVPPKTAVEACKRLRSIPGRMDVVNPLRVFEPEEVPEPSLDPFQNLKFSKYSPALKSRGLPLVIVDYAHTPEALSRTLFALKTTLNMRHGKLWCIMGCGGNRDPEKRTHMGRIAAEESDFLTITNDNPRDEDPQAIANAVFAGTEEAVPERGKAQVRILLDREQAIKEAIEQAQARDMVIIVGKGSENTQTIGKQVLPFSDKAIAQVALGARAALLTEIPEDNMMDGLPL
jgi:UDP-N-acetylmuramyl tripeptide synthase